MCKCTPERKTPFCGKPGCQWPEQKPTSVDLPESHEIEAERKRLAKMLYDMAMVYPSGTERMALAIASRAVGRGRQLTAVEQMTNLKKALDEWESEEREQVSDASPPAPRERSEHGTEEQDDGK